MSDIAMLVAEEYERRVKISRKSGVASDAELNLLSSVAELTRRLDGSSLMKKYLGEERVDMVLKWDAEPKSKIALAAVNGFFSA